MKRSEIPQHRLRGTFRTLNRQTMCNPDPGRSKPQPFGMDSDLFHKTIKLTLRES